MLAGVEILLERMKTNPEEFVEAAISKWAIVLSNVSGVLNDEELKALEEALKELKRNHFNGEVMRVLAQGHDDQLVRTDDYLVKQSAIISSKSMIAQANGILNQEFDKAYAGQNTANNLARWDGTSPYQQRK
jgi:hypothetical protein